MHNQAWLNAQPCLDALAFDRGLFYGDGFFTTMLCYQQQALNWPAHSQRLINAAQKLGFPPLDEHRIQQALNIALTNAPQGLAVIKLVITRGAGGAGYAAATTPQLHYLSYLNLAPAGLDKVMQQPQQHMPRLQCVQCHTPVSINPALAGIKHLNRLDNVLARNEIVQAGADDGLMFTADGHLISSTQGNVVLLRDNVAFTSRLHQAGVQGTCLQALKQLTNNATLNITWQEKDLTIQDVHHAQAVFICNTVRGVQAVAQFGDVRYDTSLIEPINQAWWSWIMRQTTHRTV